MPQMAYLYIIPLMFWLSYFRFKKRYRACWHTAATLIPRRLTQEDWYKSKPSLSQRWVPPQSSLDYIVKPLTRTYSLLRGLKKKKKKTRGQAKSGNIVTRNWKVWENTQIRELLMWLLWLCINQYKFTLRCTQKHQSKHDFFKPWGTPQRTNIARRLQGLVDMTHCQQLRLNLDSKPKYLYYLL